MLYKPFCNIQINIGDSDDAIVTNWQELKLNYTPWHVDRKPIEPLSLSEHTMVSNDLQNPHHMDLDEWKLLSQLHPANDM